MSTRERNEHYQHHVEEVQRFCRTEGRDTTWKVSGGKLQFCKSCDLNRRIKRHTAQRRADKATAHPTDNLFEPNP